MRLALRKTHVGQKFLESHSRRVSRALQLDDHPSLATRERAALSSSISLCLPWQPMLLRNGIVGNRSVPRLDRHIADDVKRACGSGLTSASQDGTV